MTRTSGEVTRVAGPLVEVAGLVGAAIHDLVAVGPASLPGEIVALRPGAATVQAFEYTGGVAPGHPVVGQGRPLSALLGPHLLGGIVDGLLRPLTSASAWLDPTHPAVIPDVEYAFAPLAVAGDAAPLGTPLGRVGDGPVPYLVLSPGPVGARVTAIREPGRYRADATVAQVEGRPVTMRTDRPVRTPGPHAGRLDDIVPLVTGQRVVDLLLPVTRGGTVAVPGGFGTGKTVLLQQVAKWCDADVVVYVGCGERGNEMADVLGELAALTDPRTGGRLADRTVVVANTSNMPMMAREASIYTGVTVAEHFRDMGYHAVVIADSTSRWAEARREFASRSGTLPAEEGFPADLASALAAFYERAGHVVTLGGATGSVTIVGAVSPPGGDLTEPVTALSQRFVRSLWTLDRDLAYARHYPAVSWSGSFARDGGAAAAWHEEHGLAGWPGLRDRVGRVLAEADRLAGLAEVVGTGAMPPREQIALLAGRLLREGLLQQSALSAADAFSAPARTAALAEALLAVADRCRDRVDDGVPAARVEETDLAPLLRAKELPVNAIPGVRDVVLGAIP